MSGWRFRLRSMMVLSGLSVAVLMLTASVPVVSAKGSNFLTGVLPPPPPGSTSTYNIAAEPQIRSTPNGNFYISSENGLGAGTDAWKSTNGGQSYGALVQPNAVSSANTSQTTGLAPGGGGVQHVSAKALM